MNNSGSQKIIKRSRRKFFGGGCFRFLNSLCRISVFLVPLCLGALVTASAVSAQDVTFEADVSASTVTLGTYVRLTLTATGVQGMDPVELPEIDGFDAEYLGPSSRVSIVNGKYSSSYAMLYNLYPKKTGQFGIPPIKAVIDGKEYSTDSINIKVVDQKSAGSSGKADSSEGLSLNERLFAVLEPDRQQAYVNGEIPVVIKLYISGVPVKNVEMPKMEHNGFLVGELKEPEQYERLINGTRYNVVEFQTSVYPMKTGELSLGPVSIQCNVVFQDASGDNRRRGFFDDDLFGSFFNTYTERPVKVKAEANTITVKPLPQEGRPDSFSGAVGSFSFNMEASPQHVKVGDPVTLRMKVKGRGSLDTFDLKGFESSKDFKAYDPEIRKEDNAKILEQVLIPQHEKVTQIPEVHFSFFDDRQEQYRTISLGPVALQVDPVAKGEEFSVVGMKDHAAKMLVREDKLGHGINFIHSRLGHIGAKTGRSSVFFVVVVFVLLGWVSGVLYYQFLYRLRTDVRFAKRLKAPQYARQGLKTAKELLEKNDASGFYDAIFTTLQKYFEHKCHMAPGTVSSSAVYEELKRRGKHEKISGKLRQVFDECEAARYASVGFGQEEMARSYQVAEEVIDWFERKF